MSGVNQIRSTFLDYFSRNGHEKVASSPLVPQNDPTLMFTNAGMVQFKNVFTGFEKRHYARATTAQKCMRAGGKHNDLDNVGYTARHLTFFEMLGNFSFGDYFKEGAIELAWNFVSRELALPREKLLVTVYHDDDEAFSLWKKIAGFSDDRIIRIPTADNFWSMGDVGPCGPCSEIFFDQGDSVAGGPPGSPDEDGDRFLEFWNLVFMQYEQTAPGERAPLPRPSIDTGMGLERIAALLQGVQSVFEVDLFRRLIGAVAEATSVDSAGPQAASHRVIADHLRASAFLVADGVTPSNEGRGYVLRRIMRRAMRHAQLLGAAEPLMHRLVGELVSEMGLAYPELTRAESLIRDTLLTEETRFRQTLVRGLSILDEESASLTAGASFSGETAFKLYDTYGFPLDLTEDALRPRGIVVDKAAFETAMERQRAEARKAWAGSGETATEAVWFALEERLGATEFLGYDREKSEGQIVALLHEGAETFRLETGARGAVLLNQTPFYAESGGQIGDIGVMRAKGVRFRVTNTQKKVHGLFVHEGVVEEGALTPGLALELEVEHARRNAVRANHSATHILHEALRRVLGDHVAQKGSLVAPDRLRFDFTHPKPLTEEEIAAVEQIANEVVQDNAPVETRLMGQDEAIRSGARALFGEKYGDEVRVVAMGHAAVDADRAFSVELCGGTHVRRTGDIGLISVVSQGAVASGVRRIEAKTAEGARAQLVSEAKALREIAALVRASVEEAPARLASLIEERKTLERELADAKRKLAMGGGGNGAAEPVRDVAGIKLFAKAVGGIDAKDLKSLVDEAKKTIGSGVVAIANASTDGKAGVVVGVTADLTARFNAIDLVRAASEKLGGKGGGGRPDLAQAGGPDASALDAALAAVEETLRQKASQ
ncbi:alanine--tRNA ligase [Methylosinus sporium]|uniref:Alanine--tRNA ligase n=1 Tax=Methylosinus sporium TaxID=428 RepID=A0A549T4U4_METSR|nr:MULTISPECIES: alanine--tRNA ligase [Methylosinus]MBU3888940.1 alanine--tRNA ligase [Methylosinus sp. KRF6]TRL36909.1 alanine--tRNA ligase [Methylosinus sporium]